MKTTYFLRSPLALALLMGAPFAHAELVGTWSGKGEQKHYREGNGEVSVALRVLRSEGELTLEDPAPNSALKLPIYGKYKVDSFGDILSGKTKVGTITQNSIQISVTSPSDGVVRKLTLSETDDSEHAELSYLAGDEAKPARTLSASLTRE